MSQTEYSERAVTPATLAQLSSGEFIGITADDPGQEMEFKGFHAKLRKTAPAGANKQQLPIVQSVTPETLKENYLRIVADTEEIVKSEMKRILADPQPRRYIVKR